MASTRKVKSRKGGTHCAAPKCYNSLYSIKCKGKPFFRYPLDEARCAVWVQNSRRDDHRKKSAKELHNLRLCADHFEPSQFTTPEMKRLVWNAVPTLFAVPNPPSQLACKRPPPTVRDQPSSKKSRKDAQLTAPAEVTSSEDASPEPEPASSTLVLDPSHSPRKKLRHEVKRWRNKAYRCKLKTQRTPTMTRSKLIAELSKVLKGQALLFVKTQILLRYRKSRGFRWSVKDKSLALSLFHASPKAYQLLRKVFALPTVQTLRKTMKTIGIYPGISDSILSALKTKLASMPKEAQLCTLAFDEMSLQERVVYNAGRDEVEGLEDLGSEKTQSVANHATAFMLRGILVKWKQAIGYILSSGPVNGDVLHKLLLKALEQVRDVGLEVKVIVCDQGSNNRRVLETLCKATPENPFFQHQGQQYFVMYDAPHLLKNVRNNLKKTGFVMGGHEVSWHYIEEFYKVDSQNPIRLAPKLSQKHVDLPPFANLSVQLAAQALSHTVAAGISTLAHLKVLPQEALHTAIFIEKVDQLFNAFNSGSNNSTQSMRHVLTETSGHQQFLQETLQWLQTLRSKSTRTLPCMSGWEMNIKSLLALWEHLHSAYGAKLLQTSRLNQDHVENLFSVIRGKNGHNFHPDAQQFRTALRATMVDSLLSHSPGSNCIDDMDAFLLNLETMASQPPEAVDQAREEQEAEANNASDQQAMEQLWKIAMPGPMPVSSTLQKVQDNVLVYIGGYIARKVRLQVCQDCATNLTRASNPLFERECFTVMKQFGGVREGLLTPSSDLFQSMKLLESTYMANASFLLHKLGVKQKLLQEFEEIPLPLACSSVKPCGMKEKVLKLFINIRLHFTLKDNSRAFSTSTGKRNRKMINLSHQ